MSRWRVGDLLHYNMLEELDLDGLYTESRMMRSGRWSHRSVVLGGRGKEGRTESSVVNAASPLILRVRTTKTMKRTGRGILDFSSIATPRKGGKGMIQNK